MRSELHLSMSCPLRSSAITRGTCTELARPFAFRLKGRPCGRRRRPHGATWLRACPEACRTESSSSAGTAPLYRDGAWTCLRCGRETADLSFLLRIGCDGPLLSALPQCASKGLGSHVVVWCFRCWAYASTRPAKLLQPCRGPARECALALARRSFLRRREHPDDGSRLGRPVQLTEARIAAVSDTWSRQATNFARTNDPAPRTAAGTTRGGEAHGWAVARVPFLLVPSSSL